MPDSQIYNRVEGKEFWKMPAHRCNAHEYCEYRQHVGHNTNNCLALKDFVEKLITDGYLKEYITNHQQTIFEQGQATNVMTLKRIIDV